MAKANGRRVRRWMWVTGAVLVLGVVGFVARPKANAEAEKDATRLGKAEVADVQVRVAEVGSVEPLVKVDVKSALSGKVVELLVREGDAVRRGQVLARVEPDVNQARDLAQVKNAVREAEIGLGEAKSTFDRNRGLAVQGLLSQQGDLESETRFRQAKASHDAAPREVPHRPGEWHSHRACRGRNHPAAECHITHGRCRHPAQHRARRHRHVWRFLVQLGHGAHDGGRRRNHDHQGRHQRGGHRQGPPRASPSR